MADCIEALITANLKTALQTVVTPTYNTSCGTVEEMRSVFKFPGSGSAFTLLHKLPKDPDADYQHTEDDKLRYNVFYFNGKCDEGSDSPIQYADRNVVADFQKAIMTDRTRGGYALNTEIEAAGQGYFYDNQGTVIPCTYLSIAVQALINADNPYELA